MRGDYIAYSPGFGSRCCRILSIIAQERVEAASTICFQTFSIVLEDDQWLKKIPTKKNQGHTRPTSKGSLRGHYYITAPTSLKGNSCLCPLLYTTSCCGCSSSWLSHKDRMLTPGRILVGGGQCGASHEIKTIELISVRTNRCRGLQA